MTFISQKPQPQRRWVDLVPDSVKPFLVERLSNYIACRANYAREYSDRQGKFKFCPELGSITEEMLELHLEGMQSYGTYFFSPNQPLVSHAVLDFDDHEGELEAMEMENAVHEVLTTLYDMDIKYELFRSSGGRGYHVWIHFFDFVDPKILRATLRFALESCGFEEGTKGVKHRQIEIFPKQEYSEPGGIGNLIRLPLARLSAPIGSNDNWKEMDAQKFIEMAPPINQSDVLRHFPEETSYRIRNHPRSKEAVKEALPFIQADDYVIWIIIGIALKAGLEDDGFDLWKEWSKSSPKYKEGECEKKWRSFKDRTRSKKVTIGTIFYYASKNGWQGAAGYSGGSELYGVVNNQIVHFKAARGGGAVEEVVLAEFVARIISEIEVDNDTPNIQRYYEIEGACSDGTPLPKILVRASEFENLKWIEEKWGAKAIARAGHGLRSHLAVAIKSLSGTIATITKYSHLGWRNIDGVDYYLHAGGAINADGFTDNICVEPEGLLREYIIPASNNLKEAVQASLQLLDVGPHEIMVPLLAAVYLAPLGEFIENDLTVFMQGPSGSFKSAITGVIQSHYGRTWRGSHLPDNWSSTRNALEYMGFLAKDALYTIDDFAPYGSQRDIQDLVSKVQYYVRAQGNRGGRNRLTANCEARPSFFPRCITLSTGEDTPPGLSVIARMLLLEVKAGDIDIKQLSKAQNNASAGIYAEALGGYVQFIARTREWCKKNLPQRQLALREQASGAHARTPDNLASLMTGIWMLASYAMDAGVMSKEDAEQFRRKAWETLLNLAKDQNSNAAEEDHVTRAINLLNAAIASGEAHLARPDGKEPLNAECCGWRVRTEEIDGRAYRDFSAQGRQIGFIENGEVYLIPEAAYKLVVQMAHAQNKPIGISAITLWKRFSEKGLLISKDARRNTIKKTVGKYLGRYVHIASNTIVAETSDSIAMDAQIEPPY